MGPLLMSRPQAASRRSMSSRAHSIARLKRRYMMGPSANGSPWSNGPHSHTSAHAVERCRLVRARARTPSSLSCSGIRSRTLSSLGRRADATTVGAAVSDTKDIPRGRPSRTLMALFDSTPSACRAKIARSCLRVTMTASLTSFLLLCGLYSKRSAESIPINLGCRQRLGPS